MPITQVFVNAGYPGWFFGSPLAETALKQVALWANAPDFLVLRSCSRPGKLNTGSEDHPLCLISRRLRRRLFLREPDGLILACAWQPNQALRFVSLLFVGLGRQKGPALPRLSHFPIALNLSLPHKYGIF